MATKALELDAMRLAIALSARGLGASSPNPPVGCVILDSEGQTVGVGYHRRKGEAHAEAHALEAAWPRARGSTAVVTLEPCNHFGRTPPCHQALINAGITRVLIAIIDPTSRGEGGAALLRQAGIDVEVGVLADEARLVLGPWLIAQQTERPYLIWPHVVAAGMTEGLADVPDAVSLRSSADVVVHADCTVEEAEPSSHGVGVLSLDSVSPSADRLSSMRSLYQAGARIALLDCPSDVVAAFLSDRLVDRVLAYVPVIMASAHRDGEPASAAIVPPGFRLVAVTKSGLYTRMEALVER